MVNNLKSTALFKEAKHYLPGGVNSPVRAFRAVGLDPLFIVRGDGSRIYDADGNAYLDYVGSWGPLIFGHADPVLVEAITEAAKRGTSFGAPTELETEMARLIVEAIDSIELVRMVNSGTEALMSALRLARAYTKREKFIKFAGCYHGHGDSFLIEAGSGAATLGVPDSPGVTKGTAQDTITLPYNDLDAVKAAFKRYGEDIAAIIVEPVAGNMGLVLPKPGFLEGLSALADQYEALLIFDEVITGFYEELSSKCMLLVAGIAEAAEANGITVQQSAVGSMFGTFFNRDAVYDFAGADQSDRESYAEYFRAFLAHGVYLAPSQFETGFISAAHSDEDIEETITAGGAAFAAVKNRLA